MKAFELRTKRESEQADFLNFLLGKYVAFGVNDPKHYPKKPFLAEKSKKKALSNEEMEAFGRTFAAKISRKEQNVSDDS